jgi:hypothetical protein
MEFVEEILCKIIGGIIRFGSRGIIILNGLSIVVSRGISVPLRSRIESETDVERFVFD